MPPPLWHPPYSDNDVLPVQEEVKIIDVKSHCAPSPLGDWWRKRGYQLTRKKYVFYRAKKMVNGCHMPGICPAAGFLDCVIIMSSTRMSITAVSDALWMDWRLDLRGSMTPSASISTTLPS
jgi:hypothetical protein